MAVCPRVASLFLPAMIFLLTFSTIAAGDEFSIVEATVESIQIAFKENKLTSRELVELYIKEIEIRNITLKSIIEVNPDALSLADKADQERTAGVIGSGMTGSLQGIPILLKDNIGTKDRLNNTAGSYALLGSVVPDDAGVVKRLRKAGAIILGKVSLSEWANFRSTKAPSGWCARSGQTENPYGANFDPCGSSAGSAVSAAANLGTVTLGTETDGSMLCPSSYNSVVGIKPTLGLTSRAGVVPITHRQDVVGPICRTVADAVYVLDAIVGVDENDEATQEASQYIPAGGYSQFLKVDGLKGKRLGMTKDAFIGVQSSEFLPMFTTSIKALREQGATLIENLEIPNIKELLESINENEMKAMKAEFKVDLNVYLQQLVTSPVRSLKDVIAFNEKYYWLEKTHEYGQDLFVSSEKTNGIDESIKKAIANLETYSKNGYEKLMKDHNLDALVTPLNSVSSMLAIGGFPGIIVPAGYLNNGIPYGICFSGLKGSEPKLIEIAYSFEQATKIRIPPFRNEITSI